MYIAFVFVKALNATSRLEQSTTIVMTRLTQDRLAFTIVL